MKYRSFLFLIIFMSVSVACSLVPLPNEAAHNAVNANPVGLTTDVVSVDKTATELNPDKNRLAKKASLTASVPKSSQGNNDGSPSQDLQRGIQFLKDGNIEAATQKFEQVLLIQKNNRTAKNMLRQIRLTPSQYFSNKKSSSQYRVLPGDSFSTIASQFLGNSLEFHSLAKLNKRLSINDLKSGDLIVVPVVASNKKSLKNAKHKDKNKGGSSARKVSSPRNADKPKIIRPVVIKTDSNTSIAKDLYESGFKSLQNGEKFDALQAFEKTLRLQPGHVMAQKQLQKLKPEVTKSLHDEAMILYKDQKVDAAIRKWDRVLVIDSTHELARIYRGRAIELQKRLDKLPKNL